MRLKSVLQAKHPENHNVKAKVRQQLQFLRDKGVIEFLGSGQYRMMLFGMMSARSYKFDSERATRFWLAIAVATLWVLSVGGEADANIPKSSLGALPENHIARRRSRKASFTRLLSCFQHGMMIIITALIAQRPLPLGRGCSPRTLAHLKYPPCEKRQRGSYLYNSSQRETPRRHPHETFFNSHPGTDSHVIVSACGAKATPTAVPIDIPGTVAAGAATMVAETQAAIPTATPLPPTPTATQTNIPLPTNTFLPVPTEGAASTSNPSAGDPCVNNVLPASLTGQKIKIRVDNPTKGTINLTVYLQSGNPQGVCGYRGYTLDAGGSLVINDLNRRLLFPLGVEPRPQRLLHGDERNQLP